MNARVIVLLPTLCMSLLICTVSQAEKFTVAKQEQQVTINIDGELFTRYILKSGNKPILWPVIGPTGKELTRRFPMEEGVEGERNDHKHHRSLWFTHGEVRFADQNSGTSFWHEEKKSGKIVHREFLKVAGGDEATIVTRNDWVNDRDERLMSDVRTIKFAADEERRWIDFDITLTNDNEEEKSIVFGDTKEGSFGVRVAGSMKVEARKENDEKRGGTIINSLGDKNGDAWGKKSSWVDYHGPVDNEVLGIAILNHPSSFRFPTYWHVRTYGLFAANVFGIHNFENSNEKDGSHTLDPGKEITFRYRVLLHKGDEKQAEIADAFVEYAKIDKESIAEEEPVPVGAAE